MFLPNPQVYRTAAEKTRQNALDHWRYSVALRLRLVEVEASARAAREVLKNNDRLAWLAMAVGDPAAAEEYADHTPHLARAVIDAEDEMWCVADAIRTATGLHAADEARAAVYDAYADAIQEYGTILK